MSETRPLNVPIARTALLEEEIQSVLAPLRSGWLVQGPKVREFEHKWSNFTGARHSVAVTSCTAALELTLAALGLEPGDEVIVPAFTWVATANVVEHLGGKVVFCDIDAQTFNLDVEDAHRRVTPRTRAIIPVHLFGLAAEMAAVRQLAERHRLAVIEDAACGFGSRVGGRHVGTLGTAGCFSFHPRKAITTGEGGMITTDDTELAAKLRRLRDHGAELSDLDRHTSPRPYRLADHPEAGYNLRMTDIQGALGSAQMDRADAILAERRRLAAAYDAAFASLGWLRTPPHRPGCEHAYQSYACLFQPELVDANSVPRIGSLRNAFMERLQQVGISTRPATHAVHMLSFYRSKYRLEPADFPRAWAANDCSVSLPLFNGMTDAEQAHVIEQVTRLGP
jgi:dTDP-4-amino-4,6-dideoxygalactose transaminase